MHKGDGTRHCFHAIVLFKACSAHQIFVENSFFFHDRLIARQNPSQKLFSILSGSPPVRASAGAWGISDKKGFGGAASVGPRMPLQPIPVLLNSWHQVSSSQLNPNPHAGCMHCTVTKCTLTLTTMADSRATWHHHAENKSSCKARNIIAVRSALLIKA